MIYALSPFEDIDPSCFNCLINDYSFLHLCLENEEMIQRLIPRKEPFLVHHDFLDQNPSHDLPESEIFEA